MNVKYVWNNWNEIDWKVVEVAVFKIQKRIFKASQRDDKLAVRKLQRLLTSSFYSRLLAVRKVSQDNQGKKTPGVDGVKSLTPKQRFTLVKNLQLKDKSKPTRRVWIPKSNGEKRPLGIPTMEQRARQCLVKLALEPEWEAKFEDNSYGFRPAMSAHDAIEAIFKSIKQKSKYVLDADIAKCFDKIDHHKLLIKMDTYPKMRKQIKAWLKSGVIDGKSWFPTNEGTPQGGVVSPLLANIALHGMEQEIKKFARTLKGNKSKNEQSLSLIRYADDFVILHEKLEIVIQCKQIITRWLKSIGLELKPSKTKITHTLNKVGDNVGFDFLGFNIRQYPVGKHQSSKSTHSKILGFKTIIKPSKDKIKAHSRQLAETVEKHRASNQVALIKELNPIITGWSNYYSTVCSKETFSYCDSVLFSMLRRWAKRRHPNKSWKWVVNKYWHSKEMRNWVFSHQKGDVYVELKTHVHRNITRHIKVKKSYSIYNGDINYWSSRLGKHPELPSLIAKLLKKQKGQCQECGLKIMTRSLMEIDHIIPVSLGGRYSISNLQILHRHYHDKKTAKDGSLNRTYDKGLIKEERNEQKCSRSVLKTSGSGDTSA